MAKKGKSSTGSFRRPLILTILLVGLGAGGWWAWQNNPQVTDVVSNYIENGDIWTLESKYTPEQIMEAHRGELIGQQKRSYQDPAYKYTPYLLLEVKYTEDKKPREGILLWGLEEGEIVLNTETWETTHGFKDCLDCGATRNDFKIINALAKRQGSATTEDLQKDLHLDAEIIEPWIESAKQKHLVVQKGNRLQLHFENPKLVVVPQTRMKQQIVSKALGSGQRVSRNYSHNQIIKIAGAAFGDDFKIRSQKEVFLPVYQLGVINADGSLHTSDWNALTGQRISPGYFKS